MGTEYVAVGFTILFLIVTSMPLGGTWRRCSREGARSWIPSSSRRAADPSPDWCRSDRTAGLETILGVAADLERVHVAGDVRDRVAPEGVAAQSRRHRQHGADARLQHHLELHVEHQPAAYSGETGLSYFSQMFSMTFLQFVTAATGMAACAALIRRAGRKPDETDWQLLPRSGPRKRSDTAAAGAAHRDGADVAGFADDLPGCGKGDDRRRKEQAIARGVVAPMVAIKQLGTNGGGYFGPNSTHPSENSTPLSNLGKRGRFSSSRWAWSGCWATS